MEIIEKIEFHQGAKADADYEAEPSGFTITFTEEFVERNFESFNDGSVFLTPAELREFNAKARTTLAKHPTTQ